jgi:hypothetical protein
MRESRVKRSTLEGMDADLDGWPIQIFNDDDDDDDRLEEKGIDSMVE